MKPDPLCVCSHVLSRHFCGKICDVCGPPKGKGRKNRGCLKFRESPFQLAIMPGAQFGKTQALETELRRRSGGDFEVDRLTRMPERQVPPDPQKPPASLETQVPRSHTPDPSTSKRAEKRMRRSGLMNAQSADVLSIVAEFPMNGAKALADLTVEGCAEGRWPSLCADDETLRKVQISRRLSDLKGDGWLIAHDHDQALNECPHELAPYDRLPDIEAPE